MATVKKFNLTFKKEPKNTGLYSVGHPDSDTNIKHDGLLVGAIAAPSWKSTNNKWCVMFMVKNAPGVTANCPWHWISIKQQFDYESDARRWIKENLEKIKSLDLHHMKEE